MTIDLHTHTTSSDGTMSPGQLVSYAHRKGLSAIAITDHDTIDGVAEAVIVGENLGIEVVPGLELSVRYQEHDVHLLGYLIDCQQSDLQKALDRLQAGRTERNKNIISKLNELGFSLRYDELRKKVGPGRNGRPHIAQLMLKKNYVKTMDEAFSKFLGKNGQAYTSRFIYDIEEAIALIKNAGGVAVLAHPLQLDHLVDDISKVLLHLSGMGLDGVEVYYPNHSRKFMKHLRSLAEKHGLLMTGGSDYHGEIRPGTTLAGGKNVSVPAYLLDKIKERAIANQNNIL